MPRVVLSHTSKKDAIQLGRISTYLGYFEGEFSEGLEIDVVERSRLLERINSSPSSYDAVIIGRDIKLARELRERYKTVPVYMFGKGRFRRRAAEKIGVRYELSNQFFPMVFTELIPYLADRETEREKSSEQSQ